MIKRELLKKIYSVGHEKYLSFVHDDKIWIMPEKAVSGAMDMYQPTSYGGEHLKKVVIKRKKAPFYARGSKVEKEKIDLDKEIRNQLERLLGISNFYVAVYMGDTSTKQNDKAVLQIYNDNEIYAYVKATTNEENARRFNKEANSLKALYDAGIECAPKVIGLDLDSDVKMFAQSSDRLMGQKVRLEFNEQILNTVKVLVQKTKTDLEYKESDFSKYINRLKDELKLFDDEQQSIVEEAIKQVEEANDYSFAFSHGDFTPWNMYYIKDEIRLFDLEYCSWSMPAYVDVFHYLSQMSLLGKRYTAQCVMQQYERNFDLINEYVNDPKFTFICYLLWIISFYIERTEDIESIREKLDVWVEMLEYLIKYLK